MINNTAFLSVISEGSEYRVRKQGAKLKVRKNGPGRRGWRRVIRQKNGVFFDTLYTLRASRGSGDAVLTNEKLPRASRREVAKSRSSDKHRLGVNAP